MTPRRPDPGNRNNCTHGTPVAEQPPVPTIERFVYDACGSQRCVDEPAAEAGDETEAGPLFQGMQHDPSAPLWDFAARHFSPALARWVDVRSGSHFRLRLPRPG